MGIESGLQQMWDYAHEKGASYLGLRGLHSIKGYARLNVFEYGHFASAQRYCQM